MAKKRRTTLTRIRAGTEDVLINPAWVTPRRPGLPRAPYSTDIGIDCDVLAARSADIEEGDLLSDNDSALLLFVFQIQLSTNTKTCLCLEVTSDEIRRIRIGSEDLTLDATWFFAQSSGIQGDLEGLARIAARIRRSADIREGDRLENSTLGKSWLVYEILNEQLTKLALGIEIQDTSLTRIRAAAADEEISPVWIRAKPSGFSKVVFQGEEIPISADVLMPTGADVLVGDALVEGDLILFVYQSLPGLVLKRALCQEAPLFREDEFSDGVTATFWTVESPGVWDEESSPGLRELLPPVVSTPGYSSGFGSHAFMHQFVASGDFDVFCALEVDDNFMDNGQFSVGYLGVLFPSGEGAVVGIQVKQASPNEYNYIRFDKTVASPLGAANTDAWTRTSGWVRLRRVGSVIKSYYSMNDQGDIPDEEGDWTEIAPSATVIAGGSGQCKVGLGGAYMGTPPGEGVDVIIFDWVRRWTGGQTIVGFIPKNGIALVGTKNGVNKEFTIPDNIRLNSEVIYWNGQRQIRGEDYTIAGSTVTFEAGHPAPALGDTLIADYLV